MNRKQATIDENRLRQFLGPFESVLTIFSIRRRVADTKEIGLCFSFSRPHFGHPPFVSRVRDNNWPRSLRKFEFNRLILDISGRLCFALLCVPDSFVFLWIHIETNMGCESSLSHMKQRGPLNEFSRAQFVAKLSLQLSIIPKDS